MDSSVLYELVKMRLNTPPTGMLRYFRDVNNWRMDIGDRDKLTFQELDELFCKPHKITLMVINKSTNKTLIHTVKRRASWKPTLGLYDDLTLADAAAINKRKMHGCAYHIDHDPDTITSWSTTRLTGNPAL